MSKKGEQPPESPPTKDARGMFADC